MALISVPSGVGPPQISYIRWIECFSVAAEQGLPYHSRGVDELLLKYVVGGVVIDAVDAAVVVVVTATSVIVVVVTVGEFCL